jgi:hypothetical protein
MMVLVPFERLQTAVAVPSASTVTWGMIEF